MTIPFTEPLTQLQQDVLRRAVDAAVDRQSRSHECTPTEAAAAIVLAYLEAERLLRAGAEVSA